MNIPKGNAWQHLRSKCFDTIPIGTSIHHSKATPLHLWRREGYFRVSNCTKNLIKIEAADSEIGAALLSDAEHLLDHAAEHHATIRTSITQPAWSSPAWTVVTAYYWAFFSATAITRLTGNTVWFLNREALSELKTLAGSLEQPNPGPMNFNLGGYLNATDRVLVLKKSRSQLHDAIWNRTSNLLSEAFRASSEAANALEFRLFWSLAEVDKRLGYSWLAETRNAVNYLPGLSYREVIHDANIDVAPYVRGKSPFTIETLITDFENLALKLRRGVPPAGQIGMSCRLVVLYASLLSMIALGLHTDAMRRGTCDTRWMNSRQGFLLSHCAGSGDKSVWPL